MSVVSIRRAVATAVSVVAISGLVAPTALAAPKPAAPNPAAPAAPAAPAKSLSGKKVFLDPGHQGNPAGGDINKPVPDGRGGTKPCQTTGATATTGKKEHTINWEVSQLVKAALESEGATVVMSRPDDKGWGSCINERAAAANRSGADLAVSIHADSTPGGGEGRSGFHLIVPQLPVPSAKVTQVQGSTGRQATEKMRDAFKAAGIPPSNYLGVDGIDTRSDIAGSNLTEIPLVFVEMGNLSNPADASALSSAEGEAKYAMIITNGIKAQLGAPVAAGTPAPSTGTIAGVDDLSGLADVGGLIEQLSKAASPEAAKELLASQGADVSADVLKAILAVVYTVFGGKLPV